MMRSCQYCGRMHAIGDDCPHRPPAKRDDTAQRQIRSSYAWTQRSREIRYRDHYLCAVCLAIGTMTWDGVGVHHIIPLAEDPDRAMDGQWLISLCDAHHRMAERGEISREMLHQMAAQAEQGIPPGVPIR